MANLRENNLKVKQVWRSQVLVVQAGAFTIYSSLFSLLSTYKVSYISTFQPLGMSHAGVSEQYRLITSVRTQYPSGNMD